MEKCPSFKSSHIQDLEYDVANQRLYVTYKGDHQSRYSYENVNASEWQSLTEASSKGTALKPVINGKDYKRL